MDADERNLGDTMFEPGTREIVLSDFEKIVHSFNFIMKGDVLPRILEMRRMMNLCATLCHNNSKSKGFYDDFPKPSEPSFPLEVVKRLALIHSEVSEALEAMREVTFINGDFKVTFNEKGKPEGLASELADIVIRVFDLAEALNIPIGDIILIKMGYNASRPHMHGKRFLPNPGLVTDGIISSMIVQVTKTLRIVANDGLNFKVERLRASVIPGKEEWCFVGYYPSLPIACASILEKHLIHEEAATAPDIKTLLAYMKKHGENIEAACKGVVTRVSATNLDKYLDFSDES